MIAEKSVFTVNRDRPLEPSFVSAGFDNWKKAKTDVLWTPVKFRISSSPCGYFYCIYCDKNVKCHTLGLCFCHNTMFHFLKPSPPPHLNHNKSMAVTLNTSEQRCIHVSSIPHHHRCMHSTSAILIFISRASQRRC